MTRTSEPITGWWHHLHSARAVRTGLFHPAFWPLTQLFGGGVWARILHPYLGVIMAVSFLVMFFRFRSLNVMTAADKEWLSRAEK